ncbi:MAG: hypothetical protein V1851_02385 [Patescibacteria group bacterium]
MQENLEVIVLEGKHTRPVPTNTEKNFKELLRKSGINQGSFKFVLGKQIRGASGTDSIVVHNIDTSTGSILIKTKIDGKKDQRFEAFLTLPENFKNKGFVFFEMLKKGAENMNHPPIDLKQDTDKEKSLLTPHNDRSLFPPPQKKSRGIGFKHFIEDDESIYIFWLEIKKLFEKDNPPTRNDLIDNFLIDFGSKAGCYRFVSDLIKKKILSENDSTKRTSFLSIGEKLSIIINKQDEKRKTERVFSKDSDSVFEKIRNLKTLCSQKELLEKEIQEQNLLIEKARKKIEGLQKQITPEMMESEEKLKAIETLLA